MQALFNLIFDNFILVFVIGAVYYIYKQYKDLQDRTNSINDIFIKTLNSYLDQKFTEAQKLAEEIKKEYGHIDQIATEIDRLLFIVEKASTKDVNDIVATSNALNKFKVDKKIDIKKYPRIIELNELGTFDEEEMESLDNGIAIARKEYNAQAFRYNEKASSFPIQYLTKTLKVKSQFSIFDAPKSSTYELNYEVFEEQEPEINSLTMLNYSKEEPEDIKKDTKEDIQEDENSQIELTNEKGKED
ncbi:MAG: LemA family protein [Candidatus Coprovivens sp.]